MNKQKPPDYVQLKKKNGVDGSWHWIKATQETRTTHWLITGCGNGLYANDTEVARSHNGRMTKKITGALCKRCDRSKRAHGK